MEKANFDKYTLITTSVYILTFLFVGIPLWWKTTEVYRYPVQHGECQSLLSEKIKHTVFAKILLDDRQVQQGLFWEELLKLGNEKQEDAVEPIFNFQWSMSITSDEEANLINNSQNISDLNGALLLYEKEKSSYKRPEGEITIVVLNKELFKHFTENPKFVLGSDRHGFIQNDGDSKRLADDVLFLVKKMVQVEKLQKLFTPPSSYSADKNPDKDRMRHFRAIKSFDLTFSLIVPQPQLLKVYWNIENAIDGYLADIIHKLKEVANIKVKSQVLFMTSLPIPGTLPKNEAGEFVLSSEQLPSLINPIEDKLGSDTSLQPNLNFVLYIPPKHQMPLIIADIEGKPVPSNAFLLPQWGGFMVHNYAHQQDNASLHVDMQRVMGVFLNHFRLLLGLRNIGDINCESFLELTGPIIREWEKDFLLRKNAQEQISSSMSSLSSLSHLLKKIRNIVIRDEIGEKVQFALTSTKDSLKLLSEGHLIEGHRAAQTAFVTSDEAFYDPSLLRLLYFPQDQKYAIYIPLFLPISIPVVTSIAYLWKYWKEVKQKKSKTD